MGFIQLPVFLGGKRLDKTSRASARCDCSIDSQLILLGRMITMEGRLLNFSTGGAMFRPRLAFLMSRRDVPVCLIADSNEIFGRIVSTTPLGFGIAFDDPLTDDERGVFLRLDQASASAAPKGMSFQAVAPFQAPFTGH